LLDVLILLDATAAAKHNQSINQSQNSEVTYGDSCFVGGVLGMSLKVCTEKCSVMTRCYNHML